MTQTVAVVLAALGAGLVAGAFDAGVGVGVGGGVLFLGTVGLLVDLDGDR